MGKREVRERRERMIERKTKKREQERGKYKFEWEREKRDSTENEIEHDREGERAVNAAQTHVWLRAVRGD